MPPVRLILGPLEALESALPAEIAAARAGDPLAPATVVVDNVLLKQYLPRTFARRGAPMLNVRFETPDELARRLSQSDPRQSVQPRLGRDAQQFLVREIAEGAGGYFAAIAGRDGFAEALGRLFRELELGGFSPVSFAQAAGERATDERGKIGQLARLYMAYQARRSGFAGPADAYEAAAAGGLEGPLFVYGVWQPAEVQAAMIERIAEQAPVTVLLPHASLDADEAHAAFRERLLSHGAVVSMLVGAKPQPGPDAVAAAVFRRGLDPAERREVELVSAPDTVREVWEAARWCLARAADGMRFSDMAVVYRNRDPYRALVDEIFSEAGIDTYLHDGRLIASHPYGQRLIALLELTANSAAFERAPVMEFLTETRLPAETSRQYQWVRPSEWESHTRDAGISGGIEQWHSRLQKLANEYRDKAKDERFTRLEKAAERVEGLIRFADDFHAAVAEHPEEATWDEHLAYARSLAKRYAAGTSEILDALEDLRALSAIRDRVPFAVFCRAVRDDLEQRDTTNVLKEPVREFGRLGVAVLDASSLRHLRFRAVYMLGVAERAWPPPPRPDPLLLEHERRSINERGGGGSLPLRTEPDRESLTFWTALQSAREHLALSYARADAGRTGKHLPSYFFRAVAETFEGRRMSLEELEWSPHVRRVEAGRLATQDIEQSLSQAEYDRGLIRQATLNGEAAPVRALASKSPTFDAAIRARRARWSAALTPYDGMMIAEQAVSAAAGASPFIAGKAVSASRLETYTECPYRYFLKYGLGVEPLDEPESTERLDALQRGTLIHEILQRFLVTIGRDDPPVRARRDDHLRVLQRISDECGEERVRAGVAGRPLYWQRDKREIDDDLVRWYDREIEECARSGLLPGAFEARFGPWAYGTDDEDTNLSTDEPLTIRIGERDVLLLGRIDRIDWDEERARFRVIDYKTGKFHKTNTFDGGESLQLPIYLSAAADMLELPVEQGEAQYYYSTGRGSFKRQTVTGDTLARQHGDFVQILETVADGVDSGFFAPNPKDGHCKWCDYKQVCDAKIERLMERKAGDERAARYTALKEIK